MDSGPAPSKSALADLANDDICRTRVNPSSGGASRNDLRIDLIQADQLIMTVAKPYRPNVGIALFNASGQVLIGRRFRDDGPEIILPGLEWQMPQGGIDGSENPREAVMRELWEETGVLHAEHLGETDWLAYDFPPFAGPSSHRLAGFRGQRQKWFALRFTGRDDE